MNNYKLTQAEMAKKGIISDEIRYIAKEEQINEAVLCEYVSEGFAVILKNNVHDIKPLGIGKNLRTKINANIGTSNLTSSIDFELEKLDISIKYGADTAMDLSTGKNIMDTRKAIMKHSSIPIGTVPVYQAAINAAKEKNALKNMSVDDIFDVIEQNGKDGVDFITVHCGVNLSALERLKKQGRVSGAVSRGGVFLLEWMVYNEKENPLYEYYDRLVDIARKYDMVLSLGDGMRPGCLEDATDRSQVQEMIFLGELQKFALENGVQVMIEGPGHIPINEIQTNIQLEKKLCNNAPFYVLGPIVTDLGIGYDHITSAIGGAMAACYGADFLCYVTPAEHLGLPTADDVKRGVIASKIAALAADYAKGNRVNIKKNEIMSKLRRDRKWTEIADLSIDPDRISEYRKDLGQESDDICTMCGDYCAIKKLDDVLKEKDQG